MIPRTIHHIWVGDPMPPHLQDLVRTWRAVHPTWHHVLWTESQLDWLTNQALFDGAEQITSHVGQFRADVARYEILHRYGGVYVDCDMEARLPFDGLLDAPAFAGRECDRWINNAVLGASPGHPLFAELVETLPEWVERNRHRPGVRPNVLSGPQFLTPIARRHPDLVVHPTETFYPYSWSELDRGHDDFPASLAVHHWDNARKRRGLPRG